MPGKRPVSSTQQFLYDALRRLAAPEFHHEAELAALGIRGAQASVAEGRERRSWRADFAWLPPAALIVEVDGLGREQWHRSEEAAVSDRHRDRICVLDGWAVLRYPASEVEADTEGVAREIIDCVLWRAGLREPLRSCDSSLPATMLP